MRGKVEFKCCRNKLTTSKKGSDVSERWILRQGVWNLVKNIIKMKSECTHDMKIFRFLTS